MTQQAIIKRLVRSWAKDHAGKGGDFTSFAQLLGGVIDDLWGLPEDEAKLIKLKGVLCVAALQAVPAWAEEGLVDSTLLADLEQALEGD